MANWTADGVNGGPAFSVGQKLGSSGWIGPTRVLRCKISQVRLVYEHFRVKESVKCHFWMDEELTWGK